MLKTYKKTTQFMSAAIMTGVFTTVSPSLLMAGQGSLDVYSKEVSTKVAQPFTNVLAFVCYLGGFVLAAAGIFGLKQHVENPGNAPMKNGLAKLGFGGMIMALPPIVSAIQGTAQNTNETTNIDAFTAQGIQ